jgi:uncharacterized membrane protein YgdD (TMEM256/DUF423 family)
MPDLLGAIGATNQTTTSSNVVSGATSLLLNLASAAGAIGINKLAQSQNQLVVPTGNPLNPVQIVNPAGLQLQTTFSQNTGTILVIGGLLFVGLLGALAFSHRG